MSKITNDGLTRSGRERMLYSCTHMATVGAKELMCAKHLTVTDGQLSNGSMPQLTRIIPEKKNWHRLDSTFLHDVQLQHVVRQTSVVERD